MAAIFLNVSPLRVIGKAMIEPVCNVLTGDAQAETVSILQKYAPYMRTRLKGSFKPPYDYAFNNANRAMTHMLGLNSKQALLSPTPVNLRQCFSSLEAADDFCRQLEDRHEIIGHELRGKRLDGRDFWASLSMRTVYSDEGQPLHYEGSLVDITERRQAEEQVRVLAYYDHVTGLPNRAITAAIISMAQQLSLRVTAEGVENRGQLNFLRACGCHEV
jgi:PAS domain S-box-containing protein